MIAGIGSSPTPWIVVMIGGRGDMKSQHLTAPIYERLRRLQERGISTCEWWRPIQAVEFARLNGATGSTTEGYSSRSATSRRRIRTAVLSHSGSSGYGCWSHIINCPEIPGRFSVSSR